MAWKQNHSRGFDETIPTKLASAGRMDRYDPTVSCRTFHNIVTGGKQAAREITLLSPTSQSAAQQHEAQEFVIQVSPTLPAGSNTTVELVLPGTNPKTRTFVGVSPEGGVFRVKAVPFPRSEPSRRLKLIITDTDGQIACGIPDRGVMVNGKPIRLYQIHRIERDSTTRVTLANGQAITGSVSGLEEVKTHIAGATSTLNLSKAQRIFIEEEITTVSAVEYRITVRQAGKVRAAKEGRFPSLAGRSRTSRAKNRRNRRNCLSVRYQASSSGST
jgi:hypothetical protein